MLDRCAPGWKYKEYTHNLCIMWHGKTYPALPQHLNVAVGHIKKMINHLEINMGCARKHLKVLQG